MTNENNEGRELLVLAVGAKQGGTTNIIISPRLE